MRLQDVAEHFGYTADNWTYKLAIEHGGYTGSKPEARMQHPTLRQRVRLIWLRRHTEGVAQRD
jgi:hypothetical protein